MQSVRVGRLRKRFATTEAVAGIDLEIRPGELFTLLGPSGCGKTTLLRLLAGLETPDEGEIWFGQSRIEELPANKRNIGMVFQSYAIFPHMSVAENVAYGLRARKVPEPEVRQRVAEALALVQMAEYGDRRPDQLSGGQQQRVALARALAPRPALLLMDEPLSNLDARLRLQMREEVRRLQRQVGITTVYVTHDQEEALAMSDRIGVMEEGHLLQVGTPAEIYGAPVSRQVASFVGTCSFLTGAVRSGELLLGDGERFARALGARHEGEVIIGLRPESVRLLPAGWDPPDEVALAATVEEEVFLGAYLSVRVRLRTGESVVCLSLRPAGSYPPGARITLAFRPDAALLFDRATGGALR